MQGIDEILNNLKNDLNPITVLGLSDVSKACIIPPIFDATSRVILIVTYNELQAQKLNMDLRKVFKDVLYIPRKDIVTYSYDAQSMDILYSRIEGIIKIFSGEIKVVVVSVETLMQPVVSRKKFQKSVLKLLVAKEYDLEKIKAQLVELRLCEM